MNLKLEFTFSFEVVCYKKNYITWHKTTTRLPLPNPTKSGAKTSHVITQFYSSHMLHKPHKICNKLHHNISPISYETSLKSLFNSLQNYKALTKSHTLHYLTHFTNQFTKYLHQTHMNSSHSYTWKLCTQS